MTSFRTLVANHAGLAEALPLIHASRCEFLSSIAATHVLEPQPCAIFQESLVYLFYGRPDAIINVWNCDPVMYATFRGDTPASYYAVVREKGRERFTEATRI